MTIAALLDASLRSQGIPIVGVSIGSDADRATWIVQYDPSATDAQKASGESLRQAFDPLAASVQAAQLDRDANMAESSTIAKALCALMLDVKLNRALTAADVPTVQALFQKAITYYKFIVTNGL